jgi:hypothetical protein
MRVGVLGDSHGDLDLSKQAVRAMGAVDLLVHTGDFYQDALLLADQLGVEVHAVVGNCDRCVPGPREELLELAGHRIFLTHGHLYGVKQGLLRLDYRAREVGADLVIFGHTHVPLSEEFNGIRYLNPGSVAWPRLAGQCSYALIRLEPGMPVDTELFTLA